jgi:hypothetical protein
MAIPEDGDRNHIERKRYAYEPLHAARRMPERAAAFPGRLSCSK